MQKDDILHWRLKCLYNPTWLFILKKFLY